MSALAFSPGPVKVSLEASEEWLKRSSFASLGLFSHLSRGLGRPYPCMGSRAGNRPGPRSPRAARGAAEGETEETHAAPWVAMPTRRRPYRLQSPSAQQRGGGEERRGASARPVPGGPRAPPARRPGRSSWQAGGTIESPRHRPLTARAPARAAPIMHRTMARPPPLPGPERAWWSPSAARPPARGPERSECRQGPRGTVGSGAGGVSLCPRARHPARWRPSARSPIPPTGGPPLRQPAPR